MVTFDASQVSLQHLDRSLNEAIQYLLNREAESNDYDEDAVLALAALQAVASVSPNALSVMTGHSLDYLTSVTEEIADGRPITGDYAESLAIAVLEQLELIDGQRKNRSVRRAQYQLERAAAAQGVDLDVVRRQGAQSKARRKSSRAFSVNAKDEAQVEAKTADRLRLAAALLLSAGFAFTAFLALDAASGVGPTSLAAVATDWVAHLVTFLPLLLLVGYLARESAQHRHVSRELKYKSIQMQSASDFAVGLTDDRQRGLFLEELGKSMFAASFNQPGKEVQAGLPADQLNAHMDKMIELARAMTARG